MRLIPIKIHTFYFIYKKNILMVKYFKTHIFQEDIYKLCTTVISEEGTIFKTDKYTDNLDIITKELQSYHKYGHIMNSDYNFRCLDSDISKKDLLEILRNEN